MGPIALSHKHLACVTLLSIYLSSTVVLGEVLSVHMLTYLPSEIVQHEVLAASALERRFVERLQGGVPFPVIKGDWTFVSHSTKYQKPSLKGSNRKTVVTSAYVTAKRVIEQHTGGATAPRRP